MPSLMIRKGAATGLIKWVVKGDQLVSVKVDFPDQVDKDAVLTFLDAKREFIIPESGRMDDTRIDYRRPLDNQGYLMMALCEMAAEIDIVPDWSTLKEV